MNKVEKIKAEIERLKNELIQEAEKGYKSEFDEGRISAFEDLIIYIDSLEDTEKDFGIKESVIPFEAGEKTGVKCGSIDNCCKGKKLSAGGFQWKYSTSTNNIEPIRASRRKICVAQYDKDGNFITAYSSCREAAKTNNLTFQVISDCINNKRKTLYGGFVWKKLIENS